MGDFSKVQIEGHLMIVTINRPERRNALSWSLIESLRQRVAEARDDGGALGWGEVLRQLTEGVGDGAGDGAGQGVVGRDCGQVDERQVEKMGQGAGDVGF